MERSGIEVPRCTQCFWGFSLLRNAVGWYENQEILDGNKQVAEESRIRPVPVKNKGMNRD